MLICYEVIYPSAVRQAVRKGARLLLKLTDDASYGQTPASHQFLTISALRKPEEDELSEAGVEIRETRDDLRVLGERAAELRRHL